MYFQGVLLYIHMSRMIALICQASFKDCYTSSLQVGLKYMELWGFPNSAQRYSLCHKEPRKTDRQVAMILHAQGGLLTGGFPPCLCR